MKSWEDIANELTEEDLAHKLYIRRGNLNGSLPILMFRTLMRKKPQLINDYKHLIDIKELGYCLSNYPLTKLYLKD